MSDYTKLKQMRTEHYGADFLQIADYTQKDLMSFIDIAIQLKINQEQDIAHHYLKGKSLAMIFEKPSTRTRVSFEAGMYQLGGTAQFLNSHDLQLGNGETVSDTAKVLSRYVDGIMIRTFGHDIVEELAKNTTIPVINGLTDEAHPCQALADMMTIYEKKRTFKGLKLAYVGDGNNVTHSLLMACALMGIDCHIAVPSGHEVKKNILEEAIKNATLSGATIAQTNDPNIAVKDADVVYTDVWASMGWKGDKNHLKTSFKDYQINNDMIVKAKDDFLFMHCLPAIRGEEVTAEVIDGENSVVFDQAENRLHIQKAILSVLL